MLTIAGGIILAVIIGILLIVYLQNIIDTGFLLLGWGLVLVVLFIFLYFLINYTQETLILTAALGIPFATMKYFERKKEKESALNNNKSIEAENKSEIDSNIESEKKSTLVDQLNIEDEVFKIKENIGYLLLDAKEDENRNRLKIIDIVSFQFKFEFFGSSEKFNMGFKKNSESYFSDFSINSYLKLSIDEIFNLKNTIENFGNIQMHNEINKGIKSSATNKSFFEDIKRIKSSENNQAFIYIYQHLISEEGIYAYEPTQCKDKIVAEVSENLSYMSMNIKVNYSNIATIYMKKWNELREGGKIIFISELDN
jgi:hypothetical protein